MINSQQWTQSGSLARVLVLGLVLVTLMFTMLLIPSRNASAQTVPKADYRFQNTLKTSVGTAPALTKIGPSSNTFATTNVDGSSRKVLRFPQGNGVKLSPTTGVVPNGTYTIVALFEFDSVSGFRRIVDFKNGTSDNGLYVQNGNLRFFPSASGTGTPIAPNTYVQVVLTRNSSGTVVGYVNGAQQFSFSDTSNDAAISANNVLRFFRDNDSGGVTTEHSAGSVARIRLYDTAFNAGEVAALDRLDFIVNSTLDAPDNNLSDGKCSTNTSNQCTLRAAIQQANATQGGNAINFAPGLSGTITLLPPGQLQITNDLASQTDLAINGPGARVLTVSANNASRVFEIASGAGATINGLTISNGNVTGPGGGILNSGGTLTLTNSTISSSTANNNFGGGINNSGGTLTLTNSTVSGNIANSNFGGGGVGGGIHNNNGGVLTLTNSTVSGNQGGFSTGGIGNFGAGSRMTLTNSTVTNNFPGGIVSEGPATVSNTIVAGNNPSNSPDAQGAFTSQGFNLIGKTDGSSGFNRPGDQVGTVASPLDPKLGPLANNRGPTNTHALLSGSPAIDRATNAGCPSTDQRGVSRPQDGDGDGTGICDIGAFEAANTPPTITKLKPAPGSETRDRTPLIVATVGDKQTNLAKANIKLFVDGERKSTFSYDASTDRLSYTSGRLSFGRHTVKIVATDGVLSTTKSWSFKVVR